MENKWKKYNGIISVKIGEDSFDMHVSNEELPQFFQISKEINSAKGEITNSISKLLLDMCKRSLKRVNSEVPEEDINSFADANGFTLVTQLFSALSGEQK